MQCSQCGEAFQDGQILRQVTQGIFNASGDDYQEEAMIGTYHTACLDMVSKEDPQEEEDSEE